MVDLEYELRKSLEYWNKKHKERIKREEIKESKE
jgi:hypothetical protein